MVYRGGGREREEEVGGKGRRSCIEGNGDKVELGDGCVGSPGVLAVNQWF